MRRTKARAFVRETPGKWSAVTLYSAICLMATTLGVWYLLQ